ncbi:GntR family transcriptional regulator [Listeria floridensis FSL S10-1187]|uniref:GntR family transcriptional regulator n=1 Tax=Listeria floridensis FSL S10-1187 TaxID=1265817 RepID=A0ABP3AYW7_9LIST|nr:FadR/GntR family transcriptional regulator [Listeria floridensis]EUJ31507.1 GntR family transcriptional regulator [Listeria floridensis FSL S10-1187]
MSAKLERKSLVEQAYDALLEKIKTEVWPVGSKIPSEKILMTELGISRNTLREAVRALSHVGLLDIKQGAGTVVTANDELSAILQRRISESTFRDTFEVRHALETEIAVLACKRRTEADLKNCYELSDRCIEAAKENDIEQFVAYDSALHEAIAKASHNKLLVDLYARLFEEIELSIYSTTKLEKDRSCGHKTLIDAIQNRDARLAKKEVSAYITTYKTRLKIEESYN